MSKSKKELETITKDEVGEFPGTAIVPAPPATDLARSTMSDAARQFLQEAKGKRQAPNKIPIIQIHHRDACFVLPSGDTVERVAGYPIYYFLTRKYYEKAYSGGPGQPPDCWSADLVVPHQDSLKKQASTCAECQWNRFQSARDGKSKACGEMTWVFLLNPEFGTPPLGVLVLPPSSIRPLRGTRFEAGYFARASAKHGVYEIVWSEFGLRQEGDPRGVQYCVVEPIMGEACADSAKISQIAGIRNQFLEAMDRLRGMTPELEGGSGLS
jgi:hypothetical protein